MMPCRKSMRSYSIVSVPIKTRDNKVRFTFAHS
jgi:hypothetical protein